MRGVVAIAALAGVLYAPDPLSGQDGHLNLFLYERSYAAVGTPTVIGAPSYYATVTEPGLLAEAQFAGHIALHRGFNSQELQVGTGGAGWNWYITPQFRLRALDVPSGPIRSPSFMPRFTIQWLRSSGADPTSPTSGLRKVGAVHFVIGHHSNGGETCEFIDEDPTDGCAVTSPPAAPPASRVAWVQGGNFSTNYVEAGYYRRYGMLSDSPSSHWRWTAEAGVAAQIHHNVIGFPLPGGAKDDFAALYGTRRVRLDLAGHVVVASAFAVRFWTRTDLFDPSAERFSGARDHTIESELFIQRVEGLRSEHWIVRAIPSFVGLGVRFVHGQDFYNTQYVRDIRNVQLFLAVDPWSPKAGN